MKAIYVAMSAAVAQEKRTAVLANNLANAASVGFKRDMAVFEVRPPEVRVKALEASVSPDLGLAPVRQRLEGTRNYVRLAETVIDFSPGVLRNTGRGLDVAIEEQDVGAGRAFFAVATPQGERYTRMGNFTLNSKGELVTQNGLRVLSRGGGAIRLGSQRPAVGPDGEMSDTREVAGALKIVYFENPADLEKVGHGLFAARSGARPGELGAGRVVARQGFLEMSNVNVVDQLVKLIETQRAYSAVEKSIQTIDEASTQAIRAVKNA